MMHIVHMLARPVSYALTSGILVLLAFYLPNGWPLIFVALLPLLYAVSHTQHALHAGALGTLYGAVIAGGTSFWYFDALPPVDSMGETAHFFMVLGSWSLMVLALAPAGAILTVFFYLTRKSWWVLGLPIALLVSEIARMYAFQLVTFAPHIQNSPFYSAGFLGYALADSSSFLQLASYGGIYALSAVVIGVNGAWWYVQKKGRIILAGVLMLFTLLPLIHMRAWIQREKNTYPLSVGLMSVYVPETQRAGEYKTQELFTEQISHAVQELAKEGAEVILLPEDGRFLQKDTAEKMQAGPLVIDVSPSKNVFGVQENVAFSGTTDGARVSPIRAKQIVTPQGEYVIASAHSIARVLGMKKQLDTFSRMITITPGRWGEGVSIPDTPLSASILFCIEMIAPNFAKTLVTNEESEVILATLSHGRFRDSWLLTVDTRRFLQVRAVEAGVPLFASGDHSIAYAIDEFGTIHFMTPENESAYRVMQLPISY